MARKFLYVCVGLLSLVVAHHFGAINASAQGSASGWFVTTNGTTAAVLMGRTITILSWAPDDGPVSAPPIPGAAQVVAFDAARAYGGLYASAVLADGSVYILRGDSGPSWTRVNGNLLGGATPATAESWGALKLKAR